VDNNGKVSLLDGERLPWENETLEAFSCWIFKLKKFCSVLIDKTDTFDIREATSELVDDLEEIGFYQVYQSLGK